jgi:hypothetical protein
MGKGRSRSTSTQQTRIWIVSLLEGEREQFTPEHYYLVPSRTPI